MSENINVRGVIQNYMFTFPFQVYPRESCLLHRIRDCVWLMSAAAFGFSYLSTALWGIGSARLTHPSKSENEQSTCAL